MAAQQAVIKARQKLMAPMYGMFQTYQKPFIVKKASMQYMYDQDGVEHLDLLANNLSISVGHCHPRVVERVQQQAKELTHVSSMYYSEPAAELTNKFLATFPERSDGEQWKVQYLVSGGEAVEMAIQMSRVTTGALDLFSLRNSYHGSLGTAMGACGIHHCKHALPETQHLHHLPAPINEDKHNIDEMIRQAELTIESSTPNRMAGFLFEQVQGYGGIHILPKEYLQRMSKIVKDYGGCLIADEIQSGLGRMGSHFWSFEMSDIEPDIVVVAKGLSNGFPLSAVVAKESLFDQYMEKNKFVFFTYGANPMGCVAASETLSVIEDEGVQAFAHEMGGYIGVELNNIKAKYPDLCVDVRGRGLMWGIELDDKFAVGIYETMKDKQILVGLGGQKKNVLRVMPPMCLTKNDVDNFIGVLGETLGEN
jgi:alanine-glyoxylate transaminase/(R)-3-amino-2-methylpropionate-pyruvate transaminase